MFPENPKDRFLRVLKKPSGFTLVELLVVIALIGVMLFVAAPVTRDVLITGGLKKASRQIIGLERKLRTDAVRDQLDYILVLNIPAASYYIITSDMTDEKRDEMKKTVKTLPSGVTILDLVNQKKEKITDGEVSIKFGRNNVCPPLVIHLEEDQDRMTLVVNPFLGVTAVYNRYAEISIDDGLGRYAAK